MDTKTWIYLAPLCLIPLAIFFAPKETLSQMLKLVNPINWVYCVAFFGLSTTFFLIAYHQPFIPIKRVVDPIAQPVIEVAKEWKEHLKLEMPKPPAPPRKPLLKRIGGRLKALPGKLLHTLEKGGDKIFDKLLDLIFNPITAVVVITFLYFRVSQN